MTHRDNVAFITGGGGAIGLGIAAACLAAGWRVALADIAAEALQEAVARLGHFPPDRLVTVGLDVRDYADWQSAATEAEDRLGPVTHLFNNAGVTSARAVFAGGGIENLSVEEWQWTNAVNIDGVFFGLKTFIPRFKAGGRPCHIVNTSSMAALVPLIGGGIPLSYAGSKAAVAHMTAQLRTDLAYEGVRNIGLSVLYPGMVKSNIQRTSLDMSPGQRLGTAEEPDMIDHGIDPLLVGEHVMRSIARGDFHIFTHAEWKERVLAYRSEIDRSFIESADPENTDLAIETIDLAHADRPAGHNGGEA